MNRYGLMGHVTRDLLTLQGAVLVHDSREELEWLFPHTRVVQLTSGSLGRPVLPLKRHPGLSHLTWPLDRSEFV